VAFSRPHTFKVVPRFNHCLVLFKSSYPKIKKSIAWGKNFYAFSCLGIYIYNFLRNGNNEVIYFTGNAYHHSINLRYASISFLIVH